jgi:hypothetical protein
MPNLTYLEQMQNRARSSVPLDKVLTAPVLVDSIEKLRLHYNKVYGEKYFTERFVPEVTVKAAPYKFALEDRSDLTPTSAQFTLGLKEAKEGGRNGPVLAQFEITMYPYCCGMRQMNGFTYHCPTTNFNDHMEELVHTFTTACLESYIYTLVTRSRRVMINFVEYRAHGLSSCDDVPPVDKPNMAYPYFFTWAQKQKKFREMVMVNSNSGNILHHAEVNF